MEKEEQFRCGRSKEGEGGGVWEPRACPPLVSTRLHGLHGQAPVPSQALTPTRNPFWVPHAVLRLQQELREARKSGSYIVEANQRRKKVAETLAERQALRKSEKDSLAKGIIPETLKDWRNYKNKSDEDGVEGLIIPLLPFGKKEYDEGERFDLR